MGQENSETKKPSGASRLAMYIKGSLGLGPEAKAEKDFKIHTDLRSSTKQEDRDLAKSIDRISASNTDVARLTGQMAALEKVPGATAKQKDDLGDALSKCEREQFQAKLTVCREGNAWAQGFIGVTDPAKLVEPKPRIRSTPTDAQIASKAIADKRSADAKSGIKYKSETDRWMGERGMTVTKAPPRPKRSAGKK